jgi:transitional endoplasmic reticulum ATPase
MTEQHYSHKRVYPEREGKVEDYLAWIGGETKESQHPINPGDIDLLREAQKGGQVPWFLTADQAANLFADSRGIFYDVSDEMRLAALGRSLAKVPDYRRQESKGTMEEFQAWVTGKTQPETAVAHHKLGLDWAKIQIENLRDISNPHSPQYDEWFAENSFAAPDGRFHVPTPQMKKWLKDYKEGKFTVATSTPTTQTKILDGDHIKLHTDPKNRTITVPQGESYEGVMKTLADAKADQEKVIHFGRVFQYRPHDGANATYNVLKRIYGVAVAKPYTVDTPMGPFKVEPELITINVGPKKRETIPWGGLAIPALPGTIVKMESQRSKLGPVFSITVDTPKFNKPAIDDLFEQIEQELKTNSIYRGKALVGAWDLEFLDVSGFNPNKIVFSDYVTEALDAALFGTIRNSVNLQRAGLPLKRSVLLYGPFGTGKSSIGQMTAQIAEQNGWTFLQARTGEDKVEDVLRTAMLYQPAVVFVEDLGEQASALNSSDKISSMLETFDGITSKDSKVVMVMTTNHVENIHKGMLRPGRIDLALHIAGLDRNGTERLFKAVIDPARLSVDVDYDKLFEFMHDTEGPWEPAWIRAVADRAQLWAINRANGSLRYKLTTEDLMNAAKSLVPQLDLLRKASEGAVIPTLHQAFNEVFENAIHGVALVDSDGDAEATWLSTHPDKRGSFRR